MRGYTIIAILLVLTSTISAQNFHRDNIIREQVDGTFYHLDLGELYVFENYEISMYCSDWLPWGCKVYKENQNSATGLDLVNEQWFMPRNDAIEISGISASSCGAGHYHILVASCMDIGLILTNGIAAVTAGACIGPVTTWNVNIIRQTDITQAVPYWIGLGKRYARNGEHNNAIFCCNYAIRLDPTCSTAMNLKGVSLVELREYDEALNSFRDATSIDPAFAEAWKNMGATLGRLNRHQDAIAALNRAVEIDSAYADAWLLMGDEFYQINDCEYATIAYNRSLDLNREFRNGHGSNMSDAWYCWGMNLSNENNYCDAYNAFKTAVDLNRYNLAAREREIAARVRCAAL